MTDVVGTPSSSSSSSSSSSDKIEDTKKEALALRQWTTWCRAHREAGRDKVKKDALVKSIRAAYAGDDDDTMARETFRRIVKHNKHEDFETYVKSIENICFYTLEDRSSTFGTPVGGDAKRRKKTESVVQTITKDGVQESSSSKSAKFVLTIVHAKAFKQFEENDMEEAAFMFAAVNRLHIPPPNSTRFTFTVSSTKTTAVMYVTETAPRAIETIRGVRTTYAYEFGNLNDVHSSKGWEARVAKFHASLVPETLSQKAAMLKKAVDAAKKLDSAKEDVALATETRKKAQAATRLEKKRLREEARVLDESIKQETNEIRREELQRKAEAALQKLETRKKRVANIGTGKKRTKSTLDGAGGLNVDDDDDAAESSSDDDPIEDPIEDDDEKDEVPATTTTTTEVSDEKDDDV